MDEIWKDIDGYEGLYQVSNFGRIKSFRESKKHHNTTWHILKPTIASNGYETVTLYRSSNDRRKFLVHRLVSIAFIPNPNHLEYINHKDENKLNNNVGNLEWCTLSYNNSYGTAKIRRILTVGSCVEQLTLDGYPLAIYISASIASKLTGIPISGIKGCCAGRIQSSGGYIWRHTKATI